MCVFVVVSQGLPYLLRVPPRYSARRWFSALNPKSMQLLRSNAAEPQWLAGYKRHLRFEQQKESYENNTWLWETPLQRAAEYALELFGLWVGGTEVMSGRLAAASLPAFLLSSQTVVQQLLWLRELARNVINNLGGGTDAAKILAILQREPKIGLHSPAITTMPDAGMWTIALVE